MKKEPMLTRFLFSSLRLTSFLVLFSLAIGLDVVSAQSSGINVPPPRQQRSWIVGRNANVESSGQAENATSDVNVIPGCTDFCLNVINPVYGKTLVGLSAQMYPCQDSDNSLFQYNNSSRAITIWDPVHNVNRCLDAGEFPTPRSNSKGFTIQKCKANATNQRWYLQADGQVQSGVVNNSSSNGSLSPQPLFMYGNGRRPEDWGKGWNSFSLYLSSEGNSDNTTSTSTFSSFSWITYASPQSAASQLAVTPRPQSSNVSANRVINGGFERFAYDPGQTGRSDFNSSIWWFTICSWTINSGSVQLVNRSIWEADQNDSENTTLHLNGYEGPGAITQLISLDSGLNYSLTFDIAGDATVSCGSVLKTMVVFISPSNVSQTFFSFNVSGKSPRSLGWTSIRPLSFTALGSSVNFTFQSSTDGSCGPLIDNVVVRMFPGPISASSLRGNRSALRRAVEVMVPLFAAGLLILTVLFCCCMWTKRRRHASRSFFVKGIRCSSDSNAMESMFKSKRLSLSFSGMSESRYSWEELQIATANFTKRLDMGTDTEGFGVHGVLYYVGEFRDGLFGIVKVDHSQRGHWHSDEDFKQEVTLLRRLHHSYLVNLVGICTGQEAMQRALIFEYIPNGNLYDRLHKAHDKEPLSWQVRMVIAYQVACALEYLHEEASPPVVHGRVQASNVLLQRDDSAKLAVFDISRSAATAAGARHFIMPIKSGHGFNSGNRDKLNAAAAESPAEGMQRTSSGHLDPAYRRTGRMSKKTDVYYYGALLLELITGVPAGSEISSKPIVGWGGDATTQSTVAAQKEEEDNITDFVDPKLLGEFNKNELFEVFDIAVKCLKPEAKPRPSMSDVVFMLRVGFSSSRPLLPS